MDDINIDPQLPWGYWLRLEYRGGKDVFIDRDGREFPSIREAFWCGHLRMSKINDQPPKVQLELMHAVLAFKIRNQDPQQELANELFACNNLVKDCYLDWLANIGLLVRDNDEPNIRGVSPEGQSALMMLDATRPTGTRGMRPSVPSIAFLAGLADDAAGEERRQRVEAAAVEWDVAFLRRRLGRDAGIILQRRGSGLVPVLQTTWSMTFESPSLRDQFYDWLCSRVDRWDAWSKIGHYSESTRLTQHLLVVLAGALMDAEIKNAVRSLPS